jgi:hypothetical protein
MGPIGCPKTSFRNYHYSLGNNPEERSSHLFGGGSLKSPSGCCIYQSIFMFKNLFHFAHSLYFCPVILKIKRGYTFNNISLFVFVIETKYG